MNTNSTSRCGFTLVAVIALAMVLSLSPAMAQTATIKFWPYTTSVIGGTAAEPHQTTDDVAGLTNQVGTPAMVTAYEACCGVLFWNPITNFFKSVCVGGGYGFTVDVNRAAPSGVASTYGGGDTWAAIHSGSPDVYMIFRGGSTVREWSLSGQPLNGIRVNPASGKVYVANFTSPGQIKELNPATNVFTTWVTGAKPYFLDADGTFIWATAVNDAGSSQPDQIIRLNPATNEVKRWNLPTNGSFFAIVSSPNMPNGIALDANGNVWFAETAANRIARLNPTTNVFDEFTKTGVATPASATGLTQPQSVATSGSGSGVQVFFPEATPSFGSALTDKISLMTLSAATPTTTTTVTPTTSTVTPTTATVTPTDVPPDVPVVTATVPPIICTSAGVDPSGITRFATGGAGLTGTGCTGFSFPSGISRVAFPASTLGSMAESNMVFQLTSSAITAPPLGTGGGACPAHEHGHVDTANPGHFAAVASPHAHHAQHGHNLVPPTTCPPHAPGHSVGLTGEAGEGLLNSGSQTDAPDFVVSEEHASFHRGEAITLHKSAEHLFLDSEDLQSAGDFTPPLYGQPMYYTTVIPAVRVGGIPAKVVFSGLAPGQKGIWEIKLVIPNELDNGSAPVEIIYDGVTLTSVNLTIE